MADTDDTDPLLRTLLGALVRSLDVDKLKSELSSVIAPPEPAHPTVPKMRAAQTMPAPRGDSDLVSRVILTDVLDESIVGARPGDHAFPLRLLLGQIADDLLGETSFAFASALNFYFRVPMEDEVKMRLGLEVSRLYYRFVEERQLDEATVRQLSPVLAELMTSQLERLKLESVDHQRVFDSAVHDRAPGSEPSPNIQSPITFLCRVASTGMVRARAQVRT